MKPQIGFSTNVFDNPFDVVSSVSRLASQFNFIELELGEAAESAVYDASPDEYARIVDRMMDFKKQGIEISIHAPYVGAPGNNLSALDSTKRDQSIARIKKSIDFAQSIGARRVTCHPGLRNKTSIDILFPILLESLKELVAYAEARDIIVCVENMGNERPNYIVLDVDQQIRMCQQTGAKIALDVIHLGSLIADENVLIAEIERLAPYVGNAHIADMNVPHHIHIPVGEGNFPLSNALDALGKYGYNGPAIIEEFGGSYKVDDYLNCAIAFKAQYEN